MSKSRFAVEELESRDLLSGSAGAVETVGVWSRLELEFANPGWEVLAIVNMGNAVAPAGDRWRSLGRVGLNR